MQQILLLNSSLNGEQGHSHQLAQRLAKGLSEQLGAALLERDLGNMELPHLTQAEMGAWRLEADQRDAAQRQLASLSEQFIDELRAADVLVLGVPMYNFGIPSSLKAWIDRVARAGVTFKYTEQGPVGLLGDKKVYLACARGGLYQGTAKDTQSAYLKDVLAFIGLNDVEFIYAEGLAMAGADERLSAAQQHIDELIRAS